MLWVKSFHIIFVASWFAGLFYLPRIFVNLAMVGADSVAERERTDTGSAPTMIVRSTWGLPELRLKTTSEPSAVLTASRRAPSGVRSIG
jgi:putative membrane protein